MTQKSEPGNKNSKKNRWYVALENRQKIGPVEKSVVDQWYSEGKITPLTRLVCELDNVWVWAGEVYPALGLPPEVTPATKPLNTTSTNSELIEGNNPFSETVINTSLATSGTQNATTKDRKTKPLLVKPHRGFTLLVLGILSMLCCPILALPVIAMGHWDLRNMKRGTVSEEGWTYTVAAVTMSWVILLILVVYVLAIAWILINNPSPHYYR
jgi:hypothetical protein